MDSYCQLSLRKIAKINNMVQYISLCSRYTKQDKLVMVLCYVKHYETIDKMKETFNISKPQLHRPYRGDSYHHSHIISLDDVEKIEDYLEEMAIPEVFPDAQFVDCDTV